MEPPTKRCRGRDDHFKALKWRLVQTVKVAFAQAEKNWTGTIKPKHGNPCPYRRLMKIGQTFTYPLKPGSDGVRGVIISSRNQEIAIRRTDDQVVNVAVHFPWARGDRMTPV